MPWVSPLDKFWFHIYFNCFFLVLLISFMFNVYWMVLWGNLFPSHECSFEYDRERIFPKLHCLVGWDLPTHGRVKLLSFLCQKRLLILELKLLETYWSRFFYVRNPLIRVKESLWVHPLKQAQIQLLVENQAITAVEYLVLEKALGRYPVHALLQVIHLSILLRCATIGIWVRAL